MHVRAEYSLMAACTALRALLPAVGRMQTMNLQCMYIMLEDSIMIKE